MSWTGPRTIIIELVLRKVGSDLIKTPVRSSSIYIIKIGFLKKNGNSPTIFSKIFWVFFTTFYMFSYIPVQIWLSKVLLWLLWLLLVFLFLFYSFTLYFYIILYIFLPLYLSLCVTQFSIKTLSFWPSRRIDHIKKSSIYNIYITYI